MSVHKTTRDSPLVKMTQVAEHKQTQLYPSLPNKNRYEVCLPLGSTGENHWTAAECHNVLKDTQSEEPVSSYDTMKEQILTLQQQNKELLAINNMWANEYRTMEQYYKKKVQFLKALKQDGKKEKAHTDTQPGKDKVRTKLQTAEEETEDLREQNDCLTRTCQQLQKEISRLNKVLKETLQSSQPLETSSETLLDIWKHQAEVYKEDFLKERKDRETLKGKNLELERRYKKLHEKLHFFKSQVMLGQPVHRCSCTNWAKHSDWS